MSRPISIIRSLDWFTIVLYLVLVALGLAAIYGAVYNFEDTSLWDFSQRYGKQLMWIGLSFVIATVLLMLDSRIYSSFAYFIYGVSIFLLIVTIIFAPEIKGSRSWLVLGPVNIQPAEFAKAATCLVVAKFMSSYGFKMTDIKDALRLCAIIVLPFVLIMLQDEAGLATVYFVLLLVLYREGMPGIILFLVFCVAVFCIVAIKYGDMAIIPAYPNESFGLLLVMIMSTLVQLVFLLIYPKDLTMARNILIGNLVIFGIASVLYFRLGISFRFTFVGYLTIALSVVYLLTMSVIRRKWAYAGIVGFLIGSLFLANVTEYVFDNMLRPHQQNRCARRGIQRKTVGYCHWFGWVVGKRFLERYANQIEICSGARYRFYLLHGRRGARFYRNDVGAHAVSDFVIAPARPCRAATFAVQPDLRLLRGGSSFLSPCHQCRNGHRTNACDWDSATVFQLRRLFALGIYDSFIYFPAVRCE